MKTLRLLVLFGVFSLVASSQSKAATDILLYEGLPDLTGEFMAVTYNHTTDAFYASGLTSDYNTSGGDVGVTTLDSYILSATISNSGNLTVGTLTINGGVGGGPDETPLLYCNLTTGPAGTAFGYGDGGGEIFQFLFKVSSGYLANAFGGSGANGGIILSVPWDSSHGDVAFNNSTAFNSNFNNSYSANGVINSFAPVPEPSSISLVLVGGVLCLVARRRLKAPRSKSNNE